MHTDKIYTKTGNVATYARVDSQHIYDDGFYVICTSLHGAGYPELAHIGLGQRKGNWDSPNQAIHCVGQARVVLLYRKEL